MSGRRNRVLRKVSKVVADDINKAYNEEYGKLVHERDEALAKVNAAHKVAVEAANTERNNDRREINKTFEEKRKEMTRKFADAA